MLWFNGQLKGRRMSVCRRESEAKLGENEGQDHLQLHHGELLADASANPHPEVHIRLRYLASPQDSIGKPFWVEQVGVRPPDIRVLV